MGDTNDNRKIKRRKNNINQQTEKIIVLPQNKNIEKPDKDEKLEAKYRVDVNEFLVQQLVDGKPKITVKQAADAIIRADGYITRAARKLRVNYATLKKVIEKNETLKRLVEEVTESTLDLAESKLKQQIVAGNLSAIIFHLKCKGRHRGWTEDQQTIASNEDKPVTFVYRLRTAMNESAN